jgi:hypothetical protein
MKLSKIALAVAGVTATLACGIATAGNFQTNSASVAREVIVGNAQAIVSPQAQYSFVAPVRSPSQDTYFQIQLELSSGEWVPGATTAGFPASNAFGNVALVDANTNLVVATAWGTLLDSGNKKRVFATFKIAPGQSVTNPVVVWNAAGSALPGPAISPAAADQLKIVGLKTLVDTIGECDTAIKNLTGAVQQYPNITDPTFIATDANSPSPASEHKLPGNQSSGPVISFPVNFQLAGVAINGATQNYNFPFSAKFFTPGGNVTVSGQTARIGTVNYRQTSQGYDTNLANVHGSVAATVPAAATTNAGAPELKDYSVTLTGTFAPSAKFWLSNAATCSDADYSAAFAVAPTAGVVTVKDVIAADLTLAAGASPALSVCYGVGAASTGAIPTTGIAATLVLNKAPDNAGDVATRFQEQPNSCNARFAVGSGIQIDVRNYASFASFGANGPKSLVRVINNSETSTADIWAQMIYSDGTYGAYGQIGSLKPREVLSLDNKELETKINTSNGATGFASAATDPFGIGAANYTRNASNVVVAGPKAGVGDRVRIVSTTGTTIRVQSFMVLGSTILDTSQAQAVDFENSAVGRSPTTALDAQPASQDAIKGLAR